MNQPPDAGGLLAKNIRHSDDPHSEIKLSELLAGARRAANDRAHELGVAREERISGRLFRR
jgi:hypothetical protein